MKEKIRILLCVSLASAMTISALQPVSATIQPEENVTEVQVDEEEELSEFDKDTWDLGGHHDDGNLIAQSEHYVFFNDPEIMGLVAYDKKTKTEIQLTNFPTANLTVKGDSLFLTDTVGTKVFHRRLLRTFIVNMVSATVLPRDKSARGILKP